MLTIQPKFLNSNYSPAFKSQNEDTNSISISDMDEDTFEQTKEDLEIQREDFEQLAEDDTVKLPSPAKKLLKGGAVVTTGLLGGMATGWGAKKSITGFKKLANTDQAKSLNKYIKSCNKLTKDVTKTIKVEIKKSDVYKKPVDFVKRNWKKFGNTPFGEPIVKFFKTIASGIKTAYKKVKDGIKYVYNKIRGVKSETWEKATVNTVGTSGGIAAGVEAAKEKSEAK
jgi:hypothetical protein